jgi:hypothetical protein
MKGELEDGASLGLVRRVAQRAPAAAGQRTARPARYPRPLTERLCHRSRPQPVTLQAGNGAGELAGAAGKTWRRPG